MHSERRVLATIVVAALMGLGLGWLLGGGPDKAKTTAAEEPMSEARPAPPPPAPAPPQIGVHKVAKVISGDTVMLEDYGPVRLLGVDVYHGPGGQPPNPDLVRASLEQLVADKTFAVDCDPATAETDFKSDDGLPLVYLTQDDGVLVNTELIARGVAIADLARSYSRRNELIMAERDARWGSRGVWDVAASKQPVLSPQAPSGTTPSVTFPARPGQTLSPQTPSQPTASKGDVLVTPDGHFHRSSCPLAKGGIPMSPEDARSHHYLACPRCIVSSKIKT